MRLAMLLLLLAPLSASAKLEVNNVQPAYGPLGPARSDDDVYPLDEYHVRYQVTGVKPDRDGKADLEVGVRLTNADGKAVFDPKPTPRQLALSLGGDAVQTAGFVTFSEKAPPGEYKLTFTLPGMQTVTRDARVQLAQETAADATLGVAGV